MEPNNTLVGTKDCNELIAAFYDSVLDVDWESLGKDEVGKGLERVLEAAYRYGYAAGGADKKNGCYKALEAFTDQITRLYLVGDDNSLD